MKINVSNFFSLRSLLSLCLVALLAACATPGPRLR